MPETRPIDPPTSPPQRFARLRQLYRRLPPRLIRVVIGLFWLGYFGFGLLILVLRYSVLPNIENHRAEIEAGISQAVGLPVSIAHIDTHWHGLRPQLSLRGFSIHDAAGRPGLTFDTVETEMSWASLWHWQLRLHRLAVDSPVLHIRRDRQGHIFIAGIALDTNADSQELSDWLLAQEKIVIRNAAIRWEDELRAAPPLELAQLDFVLRNSGRRHRFALSAVPPAELAARVDVRGDFQGRDLSDLQAWAGRLYAELDYADLAGWRAWFDYPVELPQGSGGMRVWLDYAGRQVAAVTADIALHDVQLRLARDLPRLDLAYLSGRLAGGLKENGFSFATQRLTLATQDGILLAPTDFSLRWNAASPSAAARGNLAANGLDLDVLNQLAVFLPLDAHSRQLLKDYAPQGRVFDLALGWSGEPERIAAFTLRARFEELGLRAHAALPGFVRLSGDIEGNEKRGRIRLDSRQAGLEMPELFVEPWLNFEKLHAEANWKAINDQVELTLETLSFDNRDAAGKASGRYRTRADGPGEIDLDAQLDRADGTAVWRYIPATLDPDVGIWLRESITGGRADNAHLRLKGNLRDFPFADGAPGVFQVTARIHGAQLRYAADWPGIDNIDGSLLFEGRRMLIRADQGTIQGVRVSQVAARIEDLEADEEIIRISGEAAGPTADFLRFIDASPVAGMIDHFNAGMTAQGQGRLALQMELPLRRPDETRIEGRYRFQDNTVSVHAELPPLTQVNGELTFTDRGIGIKAIQARMFDSPLTLQAQTQKNGAIDVQANGRLEIASLRKVADQRLFEHLSGSTPWRATLRLYQGTSQMSLESTLKGIASSLPEPFNKTTEESLPLRLERSHRAADAAGEDELQLSLGAAVAARLQRRERGGRQQIERGVIAIGQALPALPAQGVLLAVRLPRYDADFWSELFRPETAGSIDNPVDRLELDLAEMAVFGRTLHAVSLRGQRQNAIWRAQLASREMNGELSWNSAGRGRLLARLRDLTLDEEAPHGAPPAPAVGAAESFEELPGLDIIADSFTLHGLQLGRLELLASNAGNLWRIDRLSIQNPDGSFDSTGQWGEGSTRLDFKLETHDIGHMLTRLGLVDAVRRGKAQLSGDVSWQGPPTRIDYASLDGSLKVNASNGQFNKLEPGVGRLLGILSLQALPRRITLDFRDIFSEGFAFDSISGTALVDDSLLDTQDLQISGPAARIFMKGQANLARETQDLQVRVEPALSDTVALGAMIANPAVGAAAWVAQKLLKDPFGQMFAFEYRVTGSWSDPKVEKLQQQTATQQEGAKP